MIYIQSFINIDAGFQAILRVYLRNLGGCNVGITDLIDCFVQQDVHTKFHEDWYRRSSNIKVLPQKSERL
jgi:hypothetical protein